MVSNKFLISALVLMAAVIPASASTVTYCNGFGCDQLAAAFSGATGSLNFGSGFLTFSPGNLTGSALEYDDPTGTSFFGFLNTSTTDIMSVTGGSLQLGTNGDLVEITLPANVYAFAANIHVNAGTGNYCLEPSSTFNTSSNCNATISLSTTSAFFGVVSTSPIPTIWIGPSGPASKLVVDSFEEGTQAAATPDPATLVLIGSGLISLGWLRRRQKAIS